jgi:hypothetical protein
MKQFLAFLFFGFLSFVALSRVAPDAGVRRPLERVAGEIAGFVHLR